MTDVPVCHPDVRVFQVKRAGKHLGLWYFDPYARDGKRSGAWHSAYRVRTRLLDDEVVLNSNNNNFTKPSAGEPVLISAEHGEGLADLFEALLPHLEREDDEADEAEGEGATLDVIAAHHHQQPAGRHRRLAEPAGHLGDDVGVVEERGRLDDGLGRPAPARLPRRPALRRPPGPLPGHLPGALA